MSDERIYHPIAGWFPLAVCLGGLVLALYLFVSGVSSENTPKIILGCVTGLTCFIGLFGCMALAPNRARVLLLFGEYKGW